MSTPLERIAHWKRVATETEKPKSDSIGEIIDGVFDDVIARIESPLSSGYLAYMKSPEWRAKRSEKFRVSGYRCQDCGTRRRIIVHHLHYRTFKNESMADLRVLCAECHRQADAKRRGVVA